MGKVKLSTADTYEMQIQVHIIPTLGDVRLTALKMLMIQRLNNRKREEGLIPKSIKNIHGCLHKALSITVRIGYLSRDPAENCVLLGLRCPRFIHWTLRNFQTSWHT